MDIKRAWYTFRLCIMFDSSKRGAYVRKHQLFGACGENVRLPQMILPYHSEMIFIGNNVEIASGVRFSPHDAIHSVLNFKYHTKEFQEYVGRIEIGDNVFIGTNSVILGGTSIGSDTIVGACSLVQTSLKGGAVYGGVPANKISNYEMFVEKRRFK